MSDTDCLEDYLMSEDEMGSGFEMEMSSENDEPLSFQDAEQDDEEQADDGQDSLQLAINYKDEGDYINAVKLLQNCKGVDSFLLLLECYSLQFKYDLTNAHLKDEMISTTSQFLMSNTIPDDKIELLKSIMNLFSSCQSDFIFDIPSQSIELKKQALQFEKLFISMFQDIPSLTSLITAKLHLINIWIDSLSGCPPPPFVIDLSCEITQSLIDQIDLTLQLSINAILLRNSLQPLLHLSSFFTQLSTLFNQHITLKHNSKIFLQLNFLLGIINLSSDSPTFNDHFYQCLKLLNITTTTFNKDFEKIIASGLICNSIIIQNNNSLLVNPFDYEELKIAVNSPFIQILSKLYQNFIKINLIELHSNLVELSKLNAIFIPICNKILKLARLQKLSQSISKIYNSLTLIQLIDLLGGNMTRDQLLNLLMDSVLTNNNNLNFKLDLINDTIQFLDTKGTTANLRIKNINNFINIDWANDIGLLQNNSQPSFTSIDPNISTVLPFLTQLKELRNLNTIEEKNSFYHSKFKDFLNCSYNRLQDKN
ncbi:hypothetical protein TBLA_0B08560 [Henningerozyma blattae CBS 6284]|uniref:PCI domain-containing protein n=1 Tax=Henningerozyma blattae (strain ATCC 34711 / CBS 6284 / DSM 70876 / NBRC 10599 / NRRL Y-10934 / UCD 77-7) TaxID=1071380 RepID=I2GZW9_HENB6|nr:hypothetical protein TBLA_0B08560 [Tetrapisispora blattae CBS 6284]CCH59671.1 hypothetical protein TBLA_0B08560 [Tetrapisispora blattae CBS 6284]